MRSLYSQFYIACTMLTRIPLPFANSVIFSHKNLSASAAFFPVIGLFFGALLSLFFYLSPLIALNADMTAFVLLALPYSINRFFHFDGLCDILDAFLCDKTPKERLVILKDSRVGSFALGGGVLFLLAKFIVLKSLLAHQSAPYVLFLAPVIARYGMVPLAAFSSYPRKTGTAFHLVGKISRTAGIAATIISCVTFTVLAVFFLHQHLRVLSGTIAFFVLWIFIFRQLCIGKIGGVTGDCLGAYSESAELLTLLPFCFF
jgi:adenosylcobinamide-GDP ribazoletransferase